MIQKSVFGKLSDLRPVFVFSLENKSGSRVNIINYGAIVTNIWVRDRNGRLGDIVLGYDTLEGYSNDKFFMGAIVGRYGNRIAGGGFCLDGREYQLPVNNGKNHLHGGHAGFYRMLWDAEPLSGAPDNTLRLNLVSPDGDQGYPGTLTLSVIYTLTEANELKVIYEGKTDRPTVLNPTHHSYFNLTADFSQSILDHELEINADRFTPVDSHQIPIGELKAVSGTPMDFRKAARIGASIDYADAQLAIGNGYDHNWVLNEYDSTVRKVASVYDPSSGRALEVLTDQPGLQFYSGNSLTGHPVGKDGIAYHSRTGLCLETQHFPDSPNRPDFPSTTLRPGEIYKQTTVYKFSVRN